MNKKEKAAMDRLTAENEYLKAALDKHMQVYREMLYENVELKIFRDRIIEAVEESKCTLT